MPLIEECFYCVLPANTKGGRGWQLLDTKRREQGFCLDQMERYCSDCFQGNRARDVGAILVCFGGPKTWSKQPEAPDLKVTVRGRGGTAQSLETATLDLGRVQSLAVPLTSCVTLASYFFYCIYKMGIIIGVFSRIPPKRSPEVQHLVQVIYLEDDPKKQR